jgi:altronate dehydratase large subunit
VANPTAGAAADLLVDAGARVVFGETVEWLGAEHLLAKRAATPAVGKAIVAAVARREAAVAGTGHELTGNNPGQENIRGGLSTIEEKSLGAVAKGGTRPITGVLAIGEAPQAAGLYVMDAPAFSPESLTGFAASGANLMLFTTGAGNSFCNALAPTIKISARPDTVARLGHQIDFDASAALAGRRVPAELGPGLVDLIHAVASGERTWGEILHEGEEAFARVGGSL